MPFSRSTRSLPSAKLRGSLLTFGLLVRRVEGRCKCRFLPVTTVSAAFPQPMNKGYFYESDQQIDCLFAFSD